MGKTPVSAIDELPELGVGGEKRGGEKANMRNAGEPIFKN